MAPTVLDVDEAEVDDIDTNQTADVEDEDYQPPKKVRWHSKSQFN